MTLLARDAAIGRVLRSREEVEARIRAICFKTGPPALIGAELEWTLHHAAAPAAPLDTGAVRRALGPYTPTTLDPPRPPIHLPAGGSLTIEPGGQLEISSAPAASVPALHAAVATDLGHLERLLAGEGLALGGHGIDPYRSPRRILRRPRYAAMERVFDARGRHGRIMMSSTAGLQVCLDAGPADRLPLRWAAVNALGPPLIALFANSRRHAGRDTGLVSARMAAWWGMDPRLVRPMGGPADDPALAWSRYALAAPLVCVRRDNGCWDPPPGATLRDWVEGGFAEPLTVGDLDYHLSTLFPPVRPRGYLEVRYLDAQPGDEWIAPVAMLAALVADHATTQESLDIAGPVASRWVAAYRTGLADPPLRRAAEALVDLASRRLDRAGLSGGIGLSKGAGVLNGAGLPAPLRAHVIDTLARRLDGAFRTEEITR